MATVATIADTGIVEKVSSWTERRVEVVISECKLLSQWHRKHFLQSDPTAAQRQEFEKIFPIMIRWVKLMHNSVSDPSWPMPHLAKKVESELWTLQEIWESERNPMTAAESDKYLSELFPDAP